MFNQLTNSNLRSFRCDVTDVWFGSGYYHEVMFQIATFLECSRVLRATFCFQSVLAAKLCFQPGWEASVRVKPSRRVNK